MGQIQKLPFQLSFNSSLKVDFQGSRVTSDAGLLVVRELDERLGLSELISDNLTDARHGRNTQLPLPDLLRPSIYSRLAGYEDLNDTVVKHSKQSPSDLLPRVHRVVSLLKRWLLGTHQGAVRPE